MNSLAKSVEYINELDLSQITYKLSAHLGWSKKHAEEVARMYRNFLILKLKYPEITIMPPSDDIDEFWHMHILDTKNYRGQCDKIFGQYLNHNPSIDWDGSATEEELEHGFNTFLELYKKEFGVEVRKVRGFFAKALTNLKLTFK